METLKITSVLTALLLLVGVYAGGRAIANASHPKSRMADHGRMGDTEESIQYRYHAMATFMDSLDSRLEEKLVAVKKVEGEEKVDALTAVVEELITQRQVIHKQMMDMMPQMVQMAQTVKVTPGREYPDDYPEWE